jgi:hypothetical protein
MNRQRETRRWIGAGMWLALSVGFGVRLHAEDWYLHSFRKIQLSDKFWCEGATFGDLNGDRKMDAVAGPYWYEGPAFTQRHEYYPPTSTFERKTESGGKEKVEGFEGALGANNTYSDNFFAFIRDFNSDGANDILIIGFPGQDTSWYENPKGKEGFWTRHKVLDVTDNESPTFADLTGDGKPELVCCSKGFYGYAEPDWKDAAKPWAFHPISPNNKYHAFTHGMGLGDVNGDGKLDILEKGGWWEQPAAPRGDAPWDFHAAAFGSGGAQMFAYDVNGDGLNDVITSLAAHGYGLAWYEQVRSGTSITFKEHIFQGQKPTESKYGVAFSEPHALDLVDMDGDGLKDIVTGTRFWSHGRHGERALNATSPLYWFRLVRGEKGGVDFVPHRIDDDSGVGTQVVAADGNGDGLLDVVVGNKKGAFVFLHEKKQVSREEWEKAQPKPLPPGN